MKLSAKVKEKVARTIGSYFTTNEIVNVFSDANIPTNTELFAKWRIVLDAFDKASGIDAIFGIISEFCHPLNFRDPINFHRESFITELNSVLIYDNFEIIYTNKDVELRSLIEEKGTTNNNNISDKPEIAPDKELSECSAKEIKEAYEKFGHYKGDEYGPDADDIAQHEDIKKIVENREKVLQLRDYHQALIDVIETFCQNLKKPNAELNKAYLFLTESIQDIVHKLSLRYYEINPYKPFKDLYSAEIEWNGAGEAFDLRISPKLSWDAVRPSLYKAHSDIVRICAIAEKDSELTDNQKKLEEIAELVAKARIEKARKTDEQGKAFPIKIINPIQISREVHSKTSIPLIQKNIGDLRVEISTGDLESFNDGSIRYKGKSIEMRGQLKVLCRLFMDRQGRLVTIDHIKEELIRADKRKVTSNDTISKYVSELRNSLKVHFKKDVIFNQKEEGWFFRP